MLTEGLQDAALASVETVTAYIWRNTRIGYCPDLDPYITLSQEHLFELVTVGSAALAPVAQPWDTHRRHPRMQRGWSFSCALCCRLNRAESRFSTWVEELLWQRWEHYFNFQTANPQDSVYGSKDGHSAFLGVLGGEAGNRGVVCTWQGELAGTGVFVTWNFLGSI